MLDVTAVTNIVGTFVGIVGGVTGVASIVNQRRQTRIMEIGLERAFDTPEGEMGKGFERKIRTLLNKRLSDTRTRMKQEFDARISQIEQELKADHITEYKHILMNLSESLRDGKTISDLAEEAKRIHREILAAHERIQAESDRNSNDIVMQGREIGGLQEQVQDMRNGIDFHNSVLNQMRLIAEQLIKITNQPEMTSQHEMAEQDVVIAQNDMATQREIAGQGRTMSQDEAVRQGRTVEQDWLMGRDELTRQDKMADQDGMNGQDGASH